MCFFFFSSRRRHTRCSRDWSSDVCSSDLENLAVAYWGSDLQSVPRLFGSADWRIGGLVISIPQLLGLACSIILIWGLSLLLSRTRLGRGLRTIAEDSDTALLLGVD